MPWRWAWRHWRRAARPGHGPKPPAWLFLAGIFSFRGWLYLLALTDAHIFAYLVPFGGFAFIAGWMVLALAALKLEEPS